jgi:hypothetical protein
MKNLRIEVKISKTKQATDYEPINISLAMSADLEDDDDFDISYDDVFENLDAKTNDYLEIAVDSFVDKMREYYSKTKNTKQQSRYNI